MLTVAERGPRADGVKTMLTKQLPPAARLNPLAGQVLSAATLKSPAFAPVMLMLPTSDALPMLDKFAAFSGPLAPGDWFANAKLVGETTAQAVPGAKTPVPVKVTIAGLLPALLAMLTEAVSEAGGKDGV